MKNFKNYLLASALGFGLLLSSCGDDDAPEEENVVEVFTDVTLIFTPTSGTPVTASATDPDGAGASPLVVSGPINLAANTSYTLTYDIKNALDPNDVEDIGAEILEEDNEHQFFFQFTDGAFTDPTGNGNIGASGTVNYDDMDENGCVVGLETSWTTGDAQTASFRVNLQHQPGEKTCSTGSDTGDTDFDLTFVLNIQ
ncbi:MAG: GTP cyclohydrolase [Bacteroidota bacterium]